jgi:hypothetical protein
MDAHIRKLAARQLDVVAVWQLVGLGATRELIRHRARARGWREVHSGVYALNHSPLSQQQRWLAATLTARGSVLSHASAAACWGFRRPEGAIETITRAGSGGPRCLGGVRVFRSTRLEGHITRIGPVPITTAARTLIDVSPSLTTRATRRAFREALRLKATTTKQISAALAELERRRGTRVLGDLARRYSTVPYGRTRSDAEALALELLYEAGADLPLVNARIAGEEADLTWPKPRVIIEIDGPQYHQFPDEDARKVRVWRAAGYDVRRISSDLVYREPAALLRLVPATAVTSPRR